MARIRARVLAGVAAGIAMTVLLGRPALAPEVRGFVEPWTGMAFRKLPPGRFPMGSPPGEIGRNADESRHDVEISRTLYMGAWEITQTQWAMVMGSNPSRFQGCGRCPVEQVDFYEVNGFISRLNARSTAMRFRLPTEAEWEYACRAASQTPFAGGERLSAGEANVDGRYPCAGGAPGPARERTTPLGTFVANGWGLADMHGNVWEWTNDWYGEYDPKVNVDPAGAPSGDRRVIREGSWRFDANSARCALRYTHAPQHKGDSLGFRVVAEPIEPRQ